ncbi:MAG: hypothetical protein ACAI44_38935 [Candidatus Sericytochromatia bacterium]
MNPFIGQHNPYTHVGALGAMPAPPAAAQRLQPTAAPAARPAPGSGPAAMDISRQQDLTSSAVTARAGTQAQALGAARLQDNAQASADLFHGLSAAVPSFAPPGPPPMAPHLDPPIRGFEDVAKLWNGSGRAHLSPQDVLTHGVAAANLLEHRGLRPAAEALRAELAGLQRAAPVHGPAAAPDLDMAAAPAMPVAAAMPAAAAAGGYRATVARVDAALGPVNPADSRGLVTAFFREVERSGRSNPESLSALRSLKLHIEAHNERSSAADNFFQLVANQFQGRTRSAAPRDVSPTQAILSALESLNGDSIPKAELKALKWSLGEEMPAPGTSSLGDLQLRAGASGRLQFSGRPAFSEETNRSVRIEVGQARRHITAWHTMRNTVNGLLAAGVAPDTLADTLRAAILPDSAGARNYAAGFALTERIRPVPGEAEKRLIAVMFAMNSNTANLWPGNAHMNISINSLRAQMERSLERCGEDRGRLLGQADTWANGSEIQQSAANILKIALNEYHRTPRDAIRITIDNTLSYLDADSGEFESQRLLPRGLHDNPCAQVGRALYNHQMGVDALSPDQRLELLQSLMKYR